ncbi:hypothetical protein V3W47_03390 [Deinococcus sp. YIM 134068]|uniref:hypothetical protein n=1 Tax=Deinococcus lichenicola TaxID=3118910 RepID=UPI002F92DA9A
MTAPRVLGLMSGTSADAARGAAFAFLGYVRAQGWTNTLPQVTGARVAVSAGKLLLPPPEANP